MFVRAANPIWYFVDLEGLGLNDEFYISFLTNTFPYLPQPVFHDVNGTIPWANPLQFYPNGTLPDNLYFDPTKVYRLEIRRGPLQSDPLIYEINNFIPGITSGDTPENLGILSAENMAENSQFSQISFHSPLVLTTAGTYQIAPGWFLTLTGVGSTTVTWLILSGVQNILNNPPYALRFDSTGWSSAILTQRMYQNGAIWARGAVAFSLLGRAEISSQIVTVNYVPNAPGSPQSIASGILTTAGFQLLQGAVNIPPSTNTATSDIAYVDLQIVLPNGIVDLTNIQLVGQDAPLPSDFDPLTDLPEYMQETIPRQVDHLFNYYRYSLLQLPKHNLLTGWTFAQNPWQFTTTVDTVVAAQTQYIADQTILHQETAGAYTSQKSTQANTHFGLVLTAVNGVPLNRFALIQYIDWRTINDYFGQNLSAFVRARLFHTTGAPILSRMKMRLIYRTGGDPIPTISNTEPITGWDVNGDVTFAAGWTAVDPLNDFSYVLPNFYMPGSGVSQFPGMSFDQFAMPDAPSVTCYLGVVIYITNGLDNTLGAMDQVAFDRVSLTQNDFGIDASPETFDQTLQKCQFYYEKSYAVSTLPGNPTSINIQFARSGPTTTNGVLVPDSFDPFSFAGNFTNKCKVPALSFYTNTGTLGFIDAFMLRNGNFVPATGANPLTTSIANFNVNVGTNSFFALSTQTTGALIQAITPTAGDECVFLWHFVADSRFGI